MIEPDRLGRRYREADAVRDRPCIPRLAHAEPVHLTDFHVGDPICGGGTVINETSFVGILSRLTLTSNESTLRVAGRKGHGKRARFFTCSFFLVNELLSARAAVRFPFSRKSLFRVIA